MNDYQITPVDLGFHMTKGGLVIFRRQMPAYRWDQIFMEDCKSQLKLTRCFARSAAAVIVKDYRFPISSGFNGPPMGTPHPEERHPLKKRECPRRHYGYKAGGRGRLDMSMCSCRDQRHSSGCSIRQSDGRFHSLSLYRSTVPTV